MWWCAGCIWWWTRVWTEKAWRWRRSLKQRRWSWNDGLTGPWRAFIHIGAVCPRLSQAGIGLFFAFLIVLCFRRCFFLDSSNIYRISSALHSLVPSWGMTRRKCSARLGSLNMASLWSRTCLWSERLLKQRLWACDKYWIITTVFPCKIYLDSNMLLSDCPIYTSRKWGLSCLRTRKTSEPSNGCRKRGEQSEEMRARGPWQLAAENVNFADSSIKIRKWLWRKQPDNRWPDKSE